MSTLGNLIPLVILFAVVAGFAYVGYQVSLALWDARWKPLNLLRNTSSASSSCSGANAVLRHQIYIFANDLADRGTKKMEKKNVVFTKDGMKVGVKEMKSEAYADKTQR